MPNCLQRAKTGVDAEYDIRAANDFSLLLLDRTPTFILKSSAKRYQQYRRRSSSSKVKKPISMAPCSKKQNDAVNFVRRVESSLSLLLQGRPSQEASNNSPIVFT